MHDLHMEMTLGELANMGACTTDVLARNGLDFCCGGQRTLADACVEAELDPDAVVAELTAGVEPAKPESWSTMRPAELADHIEATHHAYLHDHLETLCSLAEKVAAVHGSKHPEVLEVYADLKDLTDDLLPHLAKEERVLFPLIRQLAERGPLPPASPMSIDMPIAAMTREHESTGALLRQLRAHSHDYVVPGDACGSYRALYEGLEVLEADTHVHIHKENNVLFPAVRQLEARRIAHIPRR